MIHVHVYSTWRNRRNGVGGERLSKKQLGQCKQGNNSYFILLYIISNHQMAKQRDYEIQTFKIKTKSVKMDAYNYKLCNMG